MGYIPQREGGKIKNKRKILLIVISLGEIYPVLYQWSPPQYLIFCCRTFRRNKGTIAFEFIVLVNCYVPT